MSCVTSEIIYIRIRRLLPTFLQTNRQLLYVCKCLGQLFTKLESIGRHYKEELSNGENVNGNAGLDGGQCGENRCSFPHLHHENYGRVCQTPHEYHHLHTDWMEEDKLPLKLDGLDLDTVYKGFVRQIAENMLTDQDDETLKESVGRSRERVELEKKMAAMDNKLWKERPLNR